ncbi:hypothetical protein J6V85_03555 [Candidatus Saccharibacteria bacterium]|nr:hypothetical protein [Candidatus Saccharibacteria bacterium]
MQVDSDHKLINLSESRYARKEALRTSLDELFWDNPDAYVQLCRFCEQRKNRISPGVKKLLVQKGFLTKTGGLPKSTNEVVYEAIMGQKPYWLE